jgi:hypothetical protein
MLFANLETVASRSKSIPACFNCRVSERQPCEVPTSCQPAAAFGREETKWSGTIRDISLGGLRLSLRRRYEPGTGLAIELGQLDDQARTVLVKVVHVKRQDDGLWSLGCKFISELSEEEIEQLVGPCGGDNSADECQSSELYAPASKIVAAVHFQVAIPSGTFVDCVVKQMIVPASWPLAAGKTVTVRGGKANGKPWQLQLQVVDCRQDRDGWHLRGRLSSAPAPSALLQALGQM